MISVKRSRLLAAGAVLAECCGLSDLTIEKIVAEARLEREHFTAEFGSIDEYLVDLQRQFLEGILQCLIQDLGATPPSLDRMRRAMELQLDICLKQRGLRRLLVDARRKVPAVADVFYKQGNVSAMMMGIELKAMGCATPAPTGRLYWSLMVEAAQLEAENGAPMPAVRETVQNFLERCCI